MARKIRNVLNVLLPIAGMVVVFASVLWVDESSLRVVLAVLGVLMIQSTAWKLTNPFFPSERRFPELRQETDSFIDLVRLLNTEAVQARDSGDLEAWERYESVLSTMHRSVDRMGALAGKEIEAAPTSAPDRED